MSTTVSRPPSPDAGEVPAGHFTHAEALWALAERDCRAGWSQPQVCARYGLGLTTLKKRAGLGGWRRCDLANAEPPPDDDPEADQPVDCAALAEDALIRVRRALRRGRAAEAASWMRLHEKLLARQEAAEERARWRERVAQARGSDGADDPLIRALRPLRERMALINSLGAAQLRVSRAYRQGQIGVSCYERFNGLHSGVADGYDHVLAAAPAPTGPTGPTGPTAVFSTDPDP